MRAAYSNPALPALEVWYYGNLTAKRWQAGSLGPLMLTRKQYELRLAADIACGLDIDILPAKDRQPFQQPVGNRAA